MTCPSWSDSASRWKLSPRRFRVSPAHYRACSCAIEPDASAASYFLAAAAITRGRVSVEGLSRRSLQGDVAFCDCLRQMGCQVEDDADRSQSWADLCVESRST